MRCGGQPQFHSMNGEGTTREVPLVPQVGGPHVTLVAHVRCGGMPGWVNVPFSFFFPYVPFRSISFHLFHSCQLCSIPVRFVPNMRDNP